MPRDETFDPANQNGYKARVLRCHACAERDRRAKEFTQADHDDAGVMFSVERKE